MVFACCKIRTMSTDKSDTPYLNQLAYSVFGGVHEILKKMLSKYKQKNLSKRTGARGASYKKNLFKADF